VNASNACGTSDWSNTECTEVEPTGGWTTIKDEDFEGAFPNDWIVRDDDTIFGETYWAKRDCNPYNGSYSGWSVGGGDGEAFECNRNGNMHVDSWMIYGPFSLADASAADLSFRVWMHLLPFPGDPISGDGIHACVSTDGPFEPGDNEGCRSEGVGSAPYLYLNWDLMELDLTDVPILGDLTGEPEVWIGLNFIADSQIDQVNMGAYVDDIVLRKYVGSMPALPEAAVDSVRLVAPR
jgi:hypothetical protein